jgi:hypothetical protein
LPHNATALKNHVPIGEFDQALNILIDHQNRLPFLTQAGQTLPDFFAY